MVWIEGATMEAIQEAARQDALLLVFIDNEDDESSHVSATLDREPVRSVIDDIRCVPLRIRAGCVAHQEFQALVPNIRAPGLYVVNKSGRVLVAVEECAPPDVLAQRLAQVLRGDVEERGPSTVSIIVDKLNGPPSPIGTAAPHEANEERCATDGEDSPDDDLCDDDTLWEGDLPSFVTITRCFAEKVLGNLFCPTPAFLGQKHGKISLQIGDTTAVPEKAAGDVLREDAASPEVPKYAPSDNTQISLGTVCSRVFKTYDLEDGTVTRTYTDQDEFTEWLTVETSTSWSTTYCPVPFTVIEDRVTVPSPLNSRTWVRLAYAIAVRMPLSDLWNTFVLAALAPGH